MFDEPFILALEERRRQALLTADSLKLQHLLADDLVYVHSTGVSDRRDSYLARITSGSLKYLELSLQGLQVQLLQQAAVVHGRMSAVISKDGQPRQVSSCFMTVWRLGTDGSWRLAAHQGTPLPAA